MRTFDLKGTISMVGLLVVATLALAALPAAASAAPWTPVPITLPSGAAGGSLRGVSCPAAGSCAAVGAFYTTGHDALRGKPTAATETGGAWEPALAILPPGSEEQSILEGVSCAAVGTCVAVGVEGKIGLMPTHPIAVAETEGHWGQAVDVTPPGGATHALLLGVSCPSADSCVAVGGDEYGPFTVTDTDGSWGTAEQITMPAGLTGPNFELPTVSLTGVSCTAVGSCAAVGEGWDASGQDQSAIGAMETDGHWAQATVVEPPTPPPSFARVYLAGVSCAAGGSCLAVGDDEGAAPFAATAALGGAWGGSSSVAPPAGTGGLLSGVSCPADGSCFAAGQATIGGKAQPMVSAESGGAWTQVAVEPPAGESFADLTGISCTSVEACVAVGTSQDSEGEQTPLLYGGGAPPTEPTPPAGGGGGIAVTVINTASSQGAPSPVCAISLGGTSIEVTPTYAAQVKLTDTGGAACDGTASLSIAAPRKAKKAKGGKKPKKASSVPIGTAPLKLDPGATETVAVKLNGAGKAALAKAGGTLKASLAVTAGGVQVTEAVKLEPAKRKHGGKSSGPR